MAIRQWCFGSQSRRRILPRADRGRRRSRGHILLSNPRQQGGDLLCQLDQADVPYEYCRQEGFRDTEPGRLVLAVLRIVCSQEDYVVHPAILGLRSGVGRHL